MGKKRQAQQLTNLRLLAAGPEREKSERPSTTCSSSFLFPANPTIVSSTRTRGPAKSRRGTRRFLEEPAGIEGWRTPECGGGCPAALASAARGGFRFARRGILGGWVFALPVSHAPLVCGGLPGLAKVCWLARAGGGFQKNAAASSMLTYRWGRICPHCFQGSPYYP